MKLRIYAFLIHFGFSALIAFVASALVFFIWYPAPLATAVGVASIFLMFLVIDITLGPLLTLLVYKPRKKTLVMDLVVIASIQLAALGYGLYSLAEGRPVWLVFAADRFELVRNNDIDLRKLDEALPEFRKPSWLGPQWVAAVRPEDAALQNEILFEAVLGGVDLAQRPNLYQPLDEQVDSIRSSIQPLSALDSFNSPEQLQSILEAQPDADGWLPLRALSKDMVVLMKYDKAEVVAIVDLRPWR